jgi:hypothetical protein
VLGERCQFNQFTQISRERVQVTFMQFVQISGKTLKRIIADNELHPGDLATAGVTDESVIRINPQGDIELRRPDSWDVIGGLLGEFQTRIKRETGLEWV